MLLEGTTAIITGGATGLGAGSAQVLAAAGAKVALIDVKDQELEQAADETGALAINCDITDPHALQSAFARANAEHGPARLLVNCAGIGPHQRLLRRHGPHDLELFQRVIDVNLTGSFNCCRLAADAMAKLDVLEGGERGVLINTASISGYESPSGGVAYGASKAGVIGMTLPMARDLAPLGIRVVAIAPGPFDTPLFRTMSPAMRDRLVGHSLFPNRAGMPAEFGGLVRQIVANPMLNGEVIRLDGGHRAPVTYV